MLLYDGPRKHRWGAWYLCVVNATPRPHYPREIHTVPIVQETEWAPGVGLDGCGKSRRPTGLRSPDRPARSESLYRLRCPSPVVWCISTYMTYNGNFYFRNTEVAVEWLACIIRTWEITGSSLGPNTVYSDWCFRGFPQAVPQSKPLPLRSTYHSIHH